MNKVAKYLNGELMESVVTLVEENNELRSEVTNLASRIKGLESIVIRNEAQFSVVISNLEDVKELVTNTSTQVEKAKTVEYVGKTYEINPSIVERASRVTDAELKKQKSRICANWNGTKGFAAGNKVFYEKLEVITNGELTTHTFDPVKYKGSCKDVTGAKSPSKLNDLLNKGYRAELLATITEMAKQK